MGSDDVDLLVVGGGINGVGVARDAAGRGLKVMLCERDDLASHTSSRSTKLIHGGLRYLEHYEFRLVRESLEERKVLLRCAPHIIRPMRFVLPHHAELRAAWLIRLGLFLYDHLGGRRHLPGSHAIDLRAHPAGECLSHRFTRGFVYSDCWVDDARLVVLNAMDARERGARICTHTELIDAKRDQGSWRCRLRSDGDGGEWEIRSRGLVNAAGAWVDQVLGERIGESSEKRLRLVAGAHIVVRALFSHDHAYLFQQPDGRVVFAIPYEHDYTLIGTTERVAEEDARAPLVTAQEVGYLCDAVGPYFGRRLTPAEVVWSYAGIRALFDDDGGDSSALSRDYALELSRRERGPPVVSVLGGKITTYRRLAEEVVDKLRDHLGLKRGRWTKHAPLPGGDMPDADFGAYLDRLMGAHPWLPSTLAGRLARAYGTRCEVVLHGATRLADLGERVAGNLHARELEYLIEHEWARSAEDILWRRTKCGLGLDEGAERDVTQWLAARDRSC